jgi:hypothetical protein
LGQRSRKRRAATGRPDPPAGTTPGRSEGPGGSDAGRSVGPNGSDPSAGPEGARRGYARSRERDEAARSALRPLDAGERPLAVTIAAGLSALIAVANLVLYLAGWQVQGRQPSIVGVLAFCVVLVSAAVGMWRMRYWAVLGFEVLLGVVMVFAALSLLVASNVQGALLAVAILALAGPLFWFLIRAMARIQMPARRPDTRAR